MRLLRDLNLQVELALDLDMNVQRLSLVGNRQKSSRSMLRSKAVEVRTNQCITHVTLQGTIISGKVCLSLNTKLTNHLNSQVGRNSQNTTWALQVVASTGLVRERTSKTQNGVVTRY